MAARSQKPHTINLIPTNEFDDSTAGRILHWTLTSFRVIVILVELVVVSGFLSRFWLDLQNSDLGDEISQKEALIQSYESFEREFRETQKRLEVYSFVASASNAVSPDLDQISAQLPSDVQLLSIDKTPTVITVRAASLSEQSINQFVAALDAPKTYKEVVVGLVESQVDSPFIVFTVQITP